MTHIRGGSRTHPRINRWKSPRLVPQVAGHSSVPLRKTNIKLFTKLREHTGVSLSKAKEASTLTNSNTDAALERFEQDLVGNRAEEVQGRTVGEGQVDVSVLSTGFSK